VTTSGNVNLFKQVAAAKQNDSLSKHPKPLKVETLQGKKRIFTDGEQVLELHDIGPNPHAKEMIVAWLPKQKLLFQGDLFFVSFDGGPLGFTQKSTLQLADKLKQLNINPERIASVHGKTATIAEFAQAVNSANGRRTSASN
jgi:glyoxylase-like metal-dependent hydrolase (beta-lactamase superfamily II)